MKKDGPEATNLHQTLGEVRDGRLTPEQAAQRLLAGEQSRLSSENSTISSQEPIAGIRNRGAIDAVSHSNNLESLQSLLQRLGRPPGDIIDSWCQQVESVAANYQVEFGRPLGVIDPSEWQVDSSGQLSWSDDHGSHLTAALGSPKDPNALAPETRRCVEAFRAELNSVPSLDEAKELNDVSVRPPDAKSTRLVESSAVADYDAVSRAEKKRQTAEKFAQALSERYGPSIEPDPEPRKLVDDQWVRPKRNLNWLYSGMAVIAFGVLAWIVTGGFQDKLAGRSKPTQDAKQTAANRSVDEVGVPSLDSGKKLDSEENQGKLEMFQPADLAVDRETTDLVIPIDEHSIDTNIDPPMTFGAMESDATELNSAASGSAASGSAALGSAALGSAALGSIKLGSTDLESADGDLADMPVPRTVPEEKESGTTDVAQVYEKILNAKIPDPNSIADDMKEGNNEFLKKQSETSSIDPQPTQVELSTAIELPPRSDYESVVPIPLRDLASTELVFPDNVQLSADHDDQVMTISTTGKQIPIANLRREESKVVFQWTPQASTTSLALMLPNGQVRSGDQKLFLRPVVRAEPTQLLLDQPELTPTWDLMTVPPSRVTRLDVEIVTPDEIEHAWLQPIDSDSPRRTIGRLVLQPTDGETIQLGVAMELRCRKTLSCRIQFVGRLDPSDPWGTTSRPLLERYLDSLAAGIQKLETYKSQMDGYYSAASTQWRRELKPRRDLIDNNLEKTQFLAERIRELHQLVGRVEREVRVKIRVWVDWPDGQEQTLFEQRD